MNGIPMKFDFSKTLNEQQSTFDYYKDRYISYELELIRDRKEIEKLNNNWNELRKWIVNNKHNENTKERYLVVDYGTLLGKMSELEGEDKRCKN